MIAIGLLILAFVLLWVVENAPRLALGQRPELRLHTAHATPGARGASRVATQLVMLGIIAVYPYLRGRPLLDYYAEIFPGEGRWLEGIHGAALSVTCLTLAYLGWLAADNIRFTVRYNAARWSRKLLVLPAAAVLGAAVEELIFRGIVLRELLESLPTWPAVLLGAVVFALAHYARRVKRTWTFFGHVMLGVLLCLAFMQTGALWLPLGLHAGGILMLSGTRPFLRYMGPRWLTGASIFPFAGATGLALLALMSVFVWSYY